MYSNQKKGNNTQINSNRQNHFEKDEKDNKRNLVGINNGNIVTYSTIQTDNIKNSEQSELQKKEKKKYIQKKQQDNIDLEENIQNKNEIKSKINNNNEINENNINDKTDLTFDERQNFFIKLYKKRKEDLEKLKQQNEKQFFKPFLISKPLNISNNYNTNVYERNYLIAQKYQKKKEDLYKVYYETPIQPILLGKEDNERILQRKNNEIFSRIFKELDSDEDNYISSYLINTKRSPPEVIKVLQPLFSELNEDKQSLDEEDFIVTMNKFFEILSKEERDILINAYKPKRARSLLNKNNNNFIPFNNSNKNEKKKNIIKKEKLVIILIDLHHNMIKNF